MQQPASESMLLFFCTQQISNATDNFRGFYGVLKFFSKHLFVYLRNHSLYTPDFQFTDIICHALALHSFSL